MAARAVCACGWSRLYKTREKARAAATEHACAAGVRRATRKHRCARCGLEAVYEDAGAAEARYWFSRHSCRKQEEAMLRAVLAEERAAAVDRTPKPCHHKQANHEHGTRACYVLDRCRCTPCATANTAAQNERNRLKAYGRYHRYVDAYPLRLHVQELREAGMGLKTIAKRSGVAHGALWKLMYGKRQPDGSQTPSRRVLRETAEKLYGLDQAWSTPLRLAGGAVLDQERSSAVSRRLQALVALGWSMSEIGRRLGLRHAANVIPIVRGERRMTVATARKANALFDELCMTLPPADTVPQRVTATRARRYAKEQDWVPPLALQELDDASPAAEVGAA
jgi:transcriptional regulator with XRE-family HTH domain